MKTILWMNWILLLHKQVQYLFQVRLEKIKLIIFSDEEDKEQTYSKNISIEVSIEKEKIKSTTQGNENDKEGKEEGVKEEGVKEEAVEEVKEGVEGVKEEGVEEVNEGVEEVEEVRFTI